MGVRTRLGAFALLVAAIVAQVGAGRAEQQATALRGDMLLGGKELVDPLPGAPKDSHAYLTITGPAAMRMYRAMKAREEKNECQEGKIKNAGSLSCTLSTNGREATCDFSINLRTGALEDGRPC